MLGKVNSFMPGNKQVFSTAMNAADRRRWDSQWGEAAQEYERALVEFPDDAAARGGLGFCFMQTKQWQHALGEYEYILQREPSNVIALSKTAELYVILNRRDDAYKAYLHLAELYSQAGQGARAEAAWQKAVQLSPGEPEPHERLAAYYVGKKDIALMIQERLAAAQGYLLRNEMEAARIQCEEVLRADRTNTQAQLLLSRSMQPSGTNAPASAAAAIGNFTGSPVTETMTAGNTSGGNTGIMGNMGNFGGAGNSMPNPAAAGMVGNGANPTPHKRITASQVTGALRQAQTFQTQGRFNDAIDLCEQILASGFDRPDARYFLGWLYQEQQRWDEAIRQFQMLLNDPDYALSCYYALGQCYQARGDLQTASVHFDEAVDRVNLDALTAEESDQLVQLCQEAAEAHRQLGEQEQAVTVYNALLGFLRSRGWHDRVSQVEFMLAQLQQAQPASRPPLTPPPPMPYAAPQPQGNVTRVLPPEQMAAMHYGTADAATQTFNAAGMLPVQPPISSIPVTTNTAGELPEWLTGILSDADKKQLSIRQAAARPEAPSMPPAQSAIANQPTMEQQAISNPHASLDSMTGVTMRKPMPPVAPAAPPVQPPVAAVQPEALPDVEPFAQPAQPPTLPAPAAPAFEVVQSISPQKTKGGAEDLLSQMAGTVGKDEVLKHVADAVLASTTSLPENIRLQVVQ